MLNPLVPLDFSVEAILASTVLHVLLSLEFLLLRLNQLS